MTGDPILDDLIVAIATVGSYLVALFAGYSAGRHTERRRQITDYAKWWRDAQPPERRRDR